MENLTHSLLGAALAEIALPRGADRTTRRIFMATGVVAANLPDVDLLYTGITPEPLGYLLHHRGHTHTVAGLVLQGLLVAGLLLLWPAVRRLVASDRRRLAALGAIGLASHLVLDSWNSYGVHPFHPLDSRWYYGDAVFIFEPWLWLFLGLAVAANATRGHSRIAVAAPVTLVPVALTALGVLSVASLAALALGGLAFAWGTRRLSPVARATAALGASGMFVVMLFGLGAIARAQVRGLLEPELRGEIVDVVLSSHPAEPHCWAAIVIEKDAGNGRFVLHRGTLSLVPALQAPADCALHRLWGLPSTPWRGEARLARSEPLAQPLARLQDLAQRDCRVAAWMQFGRAPFIRDGEIRDLRFETGPRENFTTMPLAEAGCPSNLTSWGMPRLDLLR